MQTTIHWGVDGAFTALTTSCPQVSTRAAQVFRHWIVSAEKPTLRHWKVNSTPGGWQIDSGTDEGVRAFQALEEVILWLEYSAVLVLEMPGRLKMHGALLLPPGQLKALLVLGHGGAGKSTLATAALATGWSVLADDVVFLDPSTLQAFPAPRRLGLREESQALLGEECWQRVLAAPSSSRTSRGPFFHAHELTSSPPVRDATIGALVLLSKEGPGPSLQSIDPVQAVFAVAPHCGLFRSGGLGSALAPLSQLASKVPVFELTRAPLSELQETLLSFGTTGG